MRISRLNRTLAFLIMSNLTLIKGKAMLMLMRIAEGWGQQQIRPIKSTLDFPRESPKVAS
jgi:hypothetical protein